MNSSRMTQSEKDIMQQIDSQIEGKQLTDVDEIQLNAISNAQFGEELRQKLSSLPNLVCLGLNKTEFFGIDLLPPLPRLLRLEICFCDFNVNSISEIAYKFPKLVSLRLVGCNIVSLSQIEGLRELPDLAQIDLFNNPVYKLDSSYASFHDTMFKSFRRLMYLDNLKKEAVRPCTIPASQIIPSTLVWDISLPKKSQKTSSNSQIHQSSLPNSLNNIGGNQGQFMKKNRKLNDSPTFNDVQQNRNRKGRFERDGEDYDENEEEEVFSPRRFSNQNRQSKMQAGQNNNTYLSASMK